MPKAQAEQNGRSSTRDANEVNDVKQTVEEGAITLLAFDKSLIGTTADVIM